MLKERINLRIYYFQDIEINKERIENKRRSQTIEKD